MGCTGTSNWQERLQSLTAFRPPRPPHWSRPAPWGHLKCPLFLRRRSLPRPARLRAGHAAALTRVWVSLPRADVSSGSSSTSSFRRNWRRSSSCSSSSCPSTHLETSRLRTPSSWTRAASTRKARPPAAPARPPESPTTPSTPAAPPPTPPPAPSRSRMTRVKRVAVLVPPYLSLEHDPRTVKPHALPGGLQGIMKCCSQGFTEVSPPTSRSGSWASAPSRGLSPAEGATVALPPSCCTKG